MIIDLRTILHGSHQFDFTLEPGWWQGDEQNDQIMGLGSPLNVHIDISKAGSKFVLDGRLLGRLRITCHRCLEPYHRDLGSEFRLVLSPPPLDTGQSDLELLGEDLLVDFIRGDEIDLDEIVREQIYLSLPMKSLCREDCSGLCPVCGTDLNKEKCECQREVRYSAFSRLKDLELKGG